MLELDSRFFGYIVILIFLPIMFTFTPEKPQYHAIELSNEEHRLPRRASYQRVFGCLSLVLAGLAIGLTIGFSCQTPTSTSKLQYQIPKSPIPADVLDPRVPVRFVPDERYVGSSPRVEENWRKLVRGRCKKSARI